MCFITEVGVVFALYLLEQQMHLLFNSLIGIDIFLSASIKSMFFSHRSASVKGMDLSKIVSTH